MNRWFRGGRIVLMGLAFTFLGMACSTIAERAGPWLPGAWLRAVNTISAPGALIVIFLLPLVGFDGSEHVLASFCLVIAFDTLIYSALFALSLGLLRFIVGRTRRV
jgi:hypothetical protein